MSSSLRKFACLLVCAISFTSLFAFSGCGEKPTLNYFLGDKLLYSVEVSRGKTYALDYEFSEELYDFNGWTDQLGVPVEEVKIEGTTNVFADATPQLKLYVNGLDNGHYVGDTGFRALMEIKKPTIDGWYITYSSNDPQAVIIEEKSRGIELYFIGHTTNTVTVNYTNGVELVTKKFVFECYHWDAHMVIYFMPGEPTDYDDNKFYACTDVYYEYNVPLDGEVRFEDIRMRKGNLIYRDAVIDAVKIEDESILRYDPETHALIGLKKGTTKITVYGSWYGFHGKTIDGKPASYDNLPWNDPNSPKKGSGTEAMTREMTITVK